MNIPDLRKRLRDPETRAHAAIEFGDYFRDLCLMFDCEMDTAVTIGAEIARGLNREFGRREQEPA